MYIFKYNITYIHGDTLECLSYRTCVEGSSIFMGFWARWAVAGRSVPFPTVPKLQPVSH